MIYADYPFYVSEYGGFVDEKQFNALAVKASAFLDYYTMGKAKNNAELDAIKMACCALVDKYSEIEGLYGYARNFTQSGGSVAKKSETVGSYSVTYQSIEECKSALKQAEEERADVARMYLSGTNLLYRGRC